MEINWNQGTATSAFANLQSVYLFHGADDVAKEEALVALRAATIDPDFADIDYEEIDAGAATISGIASAAGQVPFGSRARVVVVKGAELYRRREKSADCKALAALVERHRAPGCLVLVAAAPDEQSRAKTAISAEVDGAVKKSGALVAFPTLGPTGLVDLAVAQAMQQGKHLQGSAATRLVEIARKDRRAMANELAKAIAYVGNRDSILVKDIEAVGSVDPEDVMFRLTDAVARRSTDRALSMLRELLRYDPKPHAVAARLLSMLHREMRMLWQAMELNRRHISAGMLAELPDAIVDELPTEGHVVSQRFRARDLYQAASRWNRSRLIAATDLILRCDVANKGGDEGSEDVVMNLEMLIIRLCTIE